MEFFFDTLQRELLDRETWATQAQLERQSRRVAYERRPTTAFGAA